MQIKTYNIYKTHGVIMRLDLMDGRGGRYRHRKWFSLIKDGYLCAETPLYIYVYSVYIYRYNIHVYACRFASARFAKKVRYIVPYSNNIIP